MPTPGRTISRFSEGRIIFFALQKPRTAHVRTWRCNASGQLCARTGREQTQQPECPEGRLLNDLVGRDLQRQRHCEAQRLRGVKVDRQFELVQLLDRQIGRVFSLEDSTRINAALVKTLAYDCPVAHQATNLNELAPFIDRRYLVPRGKRNELLLPAGKEWIGAHVQRVGPLMSQRDENIFK